MESEKSGMGRRGGFSCGKQDGTDQIISAPGELEVQIQTGLKIVQDACSHRGKLYLKKN